MIIKSRATLVSQIRMNYEALAAQTRTPLQKNVLRVKSTARKKRNRSALTLEQKERIKKKDSRAALRLVATQLLEQSQVTTLWTNLFILAEASMSLKEDCSKVHGTR
jgi:hypothetical protein